MVGSPVDGGRDRHLFDAAGELGEQGTFGGQRADMNGMETSPVHQNGDFDARAFGQVGDEMRVADIAIELEHLAALEGIDDVGGIFMSALQVFRREWLGKLVL